MRFLYTMSLFTSLERIGNGLDDLFVFKEPKKEVKIRLGNGLGPLILGLRSATKVS